MRVHGGVHLAPASLSRHHCLLFESCGYRIFQLFGDLLLVLPVLLQDLVELPADRLDITAAASYNFV